MNGIEHPVKVWRPVPGWPCRGNRGAGPVPFQAMGLKLLVLDALARYDRATDEQAPT